MNKFCFSLIWDLFFWNALEVFVVKIQERISSDDFSMKVTLLRSSAKSLNLAIPWAASSQVFLVLLSSSWPSNTSVFSFLLSFLSCQSCWILLLRRHKFYRISGGYQAASAADELFVKLNLISPTCWSIRFLFFFHMHHLGIFSLICEEPFYLHVPGRWYSECNW